MNQTHLSAQLLQTRQHFKILDGLRGIAAVAVLIFHFMEFVTPDYKDNFIAHAYLAVDFFFCLSGFVIAYAYDGRLGKIGLMSFFKLRLIRLHPLVMIGAVIGLLAFVFDPFSDLYARYAGQTLGMFISSCLMVPYPVVQERYFNIFHLNPPSWSLFWEYVANIAYAVVLVRLRNKVLWVLLVIAAGILCYEAYTSSYLGVGWSGDTFWGGGVRVFYSFLAGMLAYRSNWIIKNNLGFGAIGVLLTLAFLVPYSEAVNWWIDTLIVVFYLPFLVALGAGGRLNTGLEGVCKFLGNISYPLYMIHYPFLWILYSYILTEKPTAGQLWVIIPICAVLLILLSYAILIFVDAPVRKWLKDRMRS
ncbi:acyltransferase family protein [Chitinophaga cymbidii]|uniref:Acyltransferase n=1 Tax=Chitinophaga cymbidii TaxID=1096750 RepID=A0A512REA6_9BACT|nr:acyltransferase [Chitinophaga cymbidii]GEP94038.1 acyltransferase [Chitinophaga cymbidii]